MSLTARRTEGNILNNCDASEFNKLAKNQREARFGKPQHGKLLLDTPASTNRGRAFVGSAKSLGSGVYRAGSSGSPR